MTESSEIDKYLVIRMLELGDVLSIALPAIRHFYDKNPAADIHCLTYGKGKDIIELGSPKTKVMCVEQGQWPDDIYQAMETFLGLAENIIGQAYTQIVNLDTTFMPCFLARFLKDAGEPVVGNVMCISVQELLDKLQSQTLEAEFVNDPAAYMDSSFFGMSRFYSQWWDEHVLPENGYAEHYLKHCCGYTDLNFDLTVTPASPELHRSGSKKSVVFATQDPIIKMTLTQVQRVLDEQGVSVNWLDQDSEVRNSLTTLRNSGLLVATPGAEHWFAAAVGCPRLLICGEFEPRMLMPEFATERFTLPETADMAESILSILSGNIDD